METLPSSSCTTDEIEVVTRSRDIIKVMNVADLLYNPFQMMKWSMTDYGLRHAAQQSQRPTFMYRTISWPRPTTFEFVADVPNIDWSFRAFSKLSGL